MAIESFGVTETGLSAKIQGPSWVSPHGFVNDQADTRGFGVSLSGEVAS